MPNDTSMPDVEAARMAFVSHIARLTLTNKGGGIDGPAVQAYRALESALTQRAQQPLKELLGRILPLLEAGVTPGDGFEGNAEFLGNIWVTAATNRIADIRAVLKP